MTKRIVAKRKRMMRRSPLALPRGAATFISRRDGKNFSIIGNLTGALLFREECGILLTFADDHGGKGQEIIRNARIRSVVVRFVLPSACRITFRCKVVCRIEAPLSPIRETHAWLEITSKPLEEFV